MYIVTWEKLVIKTIMEDNMIELFIAALLLLFAFWRMMKLKEASGCSGASFFKLVLVLSALIIPFLTIEGVAFGVIREDEALFLIVASILTSILFARIVLKLSDDQNEN
jgi:lipoprotein signal peptidase